jgi:carbonic anhydrase
MAEGKFGTAINCIDGRVQEPVINWMKVRYGLDYVDMITEPGPVRLIAKADPVALESIKRRILISTDKHHSDVIAVVGHHDCAGNSVPREQQAEQIRKSIELLKTWNLNTKLVGIYVSDTWLVTLVQE